MIMPSTVLRVARRTCLVGVLLLGVVACAPAPRPPVVGARLETLSAAERRRFEALADELPSPCGKGHSLRTSRSSDPDCLRASFAVDMLIALLGDGAGDVEIKEAYDIRYSADRPTRRSFAIGPEVPRRGPPDARVVLVEFFDYACPLCKELRPELEAVQAAYPNDVAIVYKQFPVHAGSAAAAQAALAAARQGKFEEMSALLFADQSAHARSDLDGYAQQLGLEVGRFAADFEAAAATVEAEHGEGLKAEVEGTPTIFIQGEMYLGPRSARYLSMWVAEALADAARKASDR